MHNAEQKEMEYMKERESWEEVQYISNRSSRKRSNRGGKKKKKREEIFLKEMKIENFLELMKDMNHKLSK